MCDYTFGQLDRSKSYTWLEYLDAVGKGGIAQPLEHIAPESHLNIVTHDLFLQLSHFLRNFNTLKAGVVADALEERNRVAWALAGGRREYTVGGRRNHATSDSFQTLSHSHDKGALNWWAGDPSAFRVLNLEIFMRWYLEQVGGKH